MVRFLTGQIFDGMSGFNKEICRLSDQILNQLWHIFYTTLYFILSFYFTLKIGLILRKFIIYWATIILSSQERMSKKAKKTRNIYF
jgi:hypothetical protein